MVNFIYSPDDEPNNTFPLRVYTQSQLYFIKAGKGVRDLALTEQVEHFTGYNFYMDGTVHFPQVDQELLEYPVKGQDREDCRIIKVKREGQVKFFTEGRRARDLIQAARETLLERNRHAETARWLMLDIEKIIVPPSMYIVYHGTLITGYHLCHNGEWSEFRNFFPHNEIITEDKRGDGIERLRRTIFSMNQLYA